jgi:hypothetical protein
MENLLISFTSLRHVTTSQLVLNCRLSTELMAGKLLLASPAQ